MIDWVTTGRPGQVNVYYMYLQPHFTTWNERRDVVHTIGNLFNTHPCFWDMYIGLHKYTYYSKLPHLQSKVTADRVCIAFSLAAVCLQLIIDESKQIRLRNHAYFLFFFSDLSSKPRYIGRPTPTTIKYGYQAPKTTSQMLLARLASVIGENSKL